jgi:hypothetical protein
MPLETAYAFDCSRCGGTGVVRQRDYSARREASLVMTSIGNIEASTHLGGKHLSTGFAVLTNSLGVVQSVVRQRRRVAMS